MEIPEEIVLPILSRLPTVDIVRVMAVSKSWLNVVSHQYFRNLHTSRLTRSTDRHLHHPVPLYFANYRTKSHQSIIAMSVGPAALFAKRKPGRTLYIFRDFLEDHHVYTGTGRHYCEDYVLSNTCNGLVCVTPTDHAQTIVVCNPLTLECTSLPPLTTVLSSSVALGFSPSTEQYKVVAIGYEASTHPGRVLVHTLGSTSSESWRQVLEDYRPFYRHEGPMYLDGNVYWLTDDCVVAFNLKSEKVSEIENSLRDQTIWHLKNAQLMELGGRLSLALRQLSMLNVWVFEKFNGCGDWVWKLRLNLLHIRVNTTPRFFGLREDDDGVVSILLKDAVILYDGKKKARGDQRWWEVRRLRLRRSPDDLVWNPCLSYRPSFVSLEQLGCKTMRMEGLVDLI